MTDQHQPIRVFLCDDVPAFRTLLRFTLEEDPGLRVVGEAADGRTGVEGVRETQPDVVLLDLAMPGSDGLTAIPGMREAAPDAQILGLSGYAADRVARDMLDAGAAAYLEKGADPGTIQQLVRQLAGRRAA